MIGLVDYGGGNLASVSNALDFLGAPWRQVRCAADLLATDAAVFPGVGAAGSAMNRLRSSGLDQGLLEFLRSGRPYLGICLGLQLLFQHSAEDDSPCLGFLEGEVVRLTTAEKLPHVGWNTVAVARPIPILDELDGAYFYFTHSYAVQPSNQRLVGADTDYGGRFVSVIARAPVFGVQFHPERSGRDGLRLLAQFCALAAARMPANAG
ncbi:MAG TPA: imidazole glycerol phosphate synthase subunit HisH [Candidatus Acidoferrales bacterium]|nr:imidazole glycerol phosphate synthase subunit HisH [Candidatus Acidoferrales bacterium]